MANDSIVPALGFTLAHDAIDTAIAGGKNPGEVQVNVEMVEPALFTARMTGLVQFNPEGARHLLMVIMSLC